MAAGPWNLVNIERPGTQSVIKVHRSDPTEKCIKSIVRICENVLKSLKKKIMKSEMQLLDSVLYVFHGRLRHHKTYHSLKQVQQCLKRLEYMNLRESIQHLADVCPRNLEHQNASTLLVPSQPLLEWVLLKIMGSCKLLLRLLDCCCKSFILCVQHLQWEEFIILNTVLAGLLSRLWVLFRGLLKYLVMLYEKVHSLLQDVSSVQQLPYAKQFTFPLLIKDFLGPSYSEIILTKRPSAPSVKSGETQGVTVLLNRLFTAQKPLLPENSNGMFDTVGKFHKNLAIPRKELDIGRPVSLERFDRSRASAFDVKALLRRHVPVHTAYQSNDASSVTKPCNRKSKTYKSKDSVIYGHRKKIFASKIQAVQSFSDLTEELKELIQWCRHEKLRCEFRYLGNRYLKCKCLKHLEALGYRLDKKLRFTKAVISRYLLTKTKNMHQENCVLKRKLNSKTVCRKRKYRKKLLSSSKNACKEHIPLFESTFDVLDSKGIRTVLHRRTSAIKDSEQETGKKESKHRTPKLVKIESKKTAKNTTGTEARETKERKIRRKMIKDDIDDIFASLGV
ncbi:nucleolus and neural progenitor protein [Protopterus annectens]|uniref:nucleolus and neural progenitor protein n=1 Tax=Protopterus annectens TaxID=7888 RepID=UPI001CF9D628|nr:nucleolus and neural progenitor protein [Protopterus annectens]